MKTAGCSSCGMVGIGDAADVVAVAEDQQRKDADQPVLDRVDAAHEVELLALHDQPDLVGDLDPQPLGLEDRRRQVEPLHPDHPLTLDQDSSEAGDRVGDPQAPQADGEAPAARRAHAVQAAAAPRESRSPCWPWAG